MSVFDTIWTDYHTAGATILTTTAPEAEASGADIGTAFVVAFLLAVATVILIKVLAPLAQVIQVLIGTAGAIVLTAAALTLVIVLAVG
jgi:hypothetical protein